MQEDRIFISKETFNRMLKDVKDIVMQPLHSHGIYYIHNEDDMLKGSALIIGQAGTPYEDGFYLFELKYPANYPHSPPEVMFRTNDGQTRFNPNLYITGKVCLSVLNTWQGDQWTGCQTISSLLLSICTLLNETPLLNEPGLKENHVDYNKYHNIITYKNFDTAMLEVLLGEYTTTNFPMFIMTMQTHFLERFDYTLKRIHALRELHPTRVTIHTMIYGMNITIDYNKLLDKMHNVKDSLCEKGFM